MTARTSITVPGLDHGPLPFPIASRKGVLVTTSAIHGVDPATQLFDPDPDRQAQQVFANVATVMAAAGGSLDDITQVLISVSDKAHRGLINDHWVVAFPDANSRPARNTQVRELGGGSLFSVLVTAMLD